MKEITVEAGMSLAVEVKAAHEDWIFMEFGPQVIIEEGGAFSPRTRWM